MDENTTAKKEKKIPNTRLNFALIRALAALLLAAALLALTGFAVIDLIKGPVESPAIQNEEDGAFVYREIFAIIGFYADETRGNTVTARYGLVPMDGKYVSVRFTGRYLASADAVFASTKDYIDKASDDLDSYCVVQGTVSALNEKTSGLMYDWFDLNYDQLVSLGIIGETKDYADYLSDCVLVVDSVKGYSQTLVVALTAVAAAAFLYMIVELVLMGIGFYLTKEEKAEKATEKAERAKARAQNPTEESAEESAEEPTEESAEEPTEEPTEESAEEPEQEAQTAPDGDGN